MAKAITNFINTKYIINFIIYKLQTNVTKNMIGRASDGKCL